MAGTTATRFPGILVFLAILFPALCHALPGDLDDSGRVDGYDLMLFARANGATDGDANWLARADFDGNGTIDDADLAILSSHFGRTGAAFGIWAAVYQSGYKVVRLAADTRLLGTSPNLPSSASQLVGNPRDGTVWVMTNSAVLLLNATNNAILKTISNISPAAIAFNADDQSLWVCERSQQRLIRFDAGLPAAYDLAADSGHHRIFTGFNYPSGIDVDSRTNTVWVADGSNNLIRLRGDAPDGYDIGTDTGYHRVIPSMPASLLRVNQGDSTIWLADGSTLKRLDATGRTVLVQIDGLSNASGMDVNPMDGSVTVADNGLKVVWRISADGAILFRREGFSNPVGIAVNPLDATVWVADTTTNLLTHLAANGSKLGETDAAAGITGPLTLMPVGGAADRFPSAIALADRNNVGVGETVHFTGIGSDSDGTIIRYRWDFDGDGTFDAVSTDSGDASYTYTATGIYTPIFEVTDNDRLVAIDHRLVIRVGELTAQAQADTTSGQAPLAVTFDGSFTDPLDGRVDSYQWDFDGDGIFDFYSDTSPQTSYSYPRAGTYRAVFKVTDGPHSAIDSLTITVSKAPPTATATATPDSGTSPLTVTLDGQTADPDGTIILYQWDFDGDGTADWSSTNTATTTHTFTTEGTHTCRLTVTDDDGQSASDTVTVTVGLPPPVPLANASPTVGHAPLAVNFTAAGSTAPAGTITTYEWDVGDCTILFRDDAEQGITNWQADSPWGVTDQEFASSNHAFTDSPDGDYASYTDSYLTLQLPLDLSGENAATLSFWHRYSLGRYSTARVEISTDGGGSWQQAASFESHKNEWGRATVDLAPYLPTDQFLIRFHLDAGYADDGWYLDDIQIAACQEAWTTSADGTASHTYTTAGDYTATLRVTDDHGHQGTATVPIRVLADTQPTATVSATPTSGTAPLSVTFTPTGSEPGGTITGYAWTFGEDILWTANTTTASRQWPITGRVLASATNLQDISSVAIDPTDGSLWVADRSIDAIIHFGTNGTELARLPITDPTDIVVDGDTLWVGRRYALTHFSKDGGLLADITGFSYTPTGLAVDSSAGVIWVADRYNDRVVRIDRAVPSGYDIGKARGFHSVVTGFDDPLDIALAADGSVWVSDLYHREVVHLAADGSTLARIKGFSSPSSLVMGQDVLWVANYATVVRLAATVADGYDISTDTGSHMLVEGFSEVTDVAIDSSSGDVWVIDQSAQKVTRFAADGTLQKQFSVADGSKYLAFLGRGTANQQITTTADPVSHTFTTPGTYPVRLTATDANGRTAFADIDITVAGPPAVSLVATPPSGNAPLSVFFTPTTRDLDGVVTEYAWDFDDDGTVDLQATAALPVSHTYTAGTHTARLRVTDNDGLSTEATVTVSVDQSPPSVAAQAVPITGHAPLAVDFTADAADPDGQVATIAWDFDGDGVTDATGANATHTFTAAGSYPVTVRVTDNDGNDTTKQLTVTVAATGAPWPILAADRTSAATGQTVTICAGGVDPDGTISEAAIDFDGDGTFDQSAAAPFTVFADDFETDTGLWTADAPWTRSSEAAASGVFAYTDSEGQPYANDFNGSLTSTAIDLSTSVAPHLIFQHRYELRYGDNAYVEISTDNGATWTRLATYSNGSTDWQRENIDLRTYAGAAAVIIRFRLVTSSQDTADGWHIDDVFVGDCLSHAYGNVGGYTPTLRLTDDASNQYSRAIDLRIDHPKAEPRIWVADTDHNRVTEFTADGTELRRLDGLSSPRMVTVDETTGTIWVADTGSDRVVRLAASAQNGYRPGSTPVADASPSGAGGFLAGDATYGTGKLNGGLILDGDGDYAQIADRPAFHNPSFTLEAWVYPTAASGVDPVAGKISQAKDFALVLNNGIPAALVYDGGRRYIQAANAAPLNQWTHLAMTYDHASRLVILYVNGVEAARANYFADTTNTDSFFIGKGYWSDEYFTGTIDEVRFWTTVRTQAEIAGGMNAELTGTETGLAGYWRLNGDPGGITVTSGFNDPYFIAVAADHSVWVSDYSNNQVVHLAADGTELARIDGFHRPRGITVSSSDGTIWVADTNNDQIVKLDANGTELQRFGGFNDPVAIRQAASSNTFWITDYYHFQVVRLGADGSELLRLDGFYYPVGIDVRQADGSVWVADYDNDQVVKLDANGNERIRRSGFDNPHHLTVDQDDGSVWIADMYNNRVVHLASDGTLLSTIGGLYRPLYVTVVHPAAGDAAAQPPTATATASPTAGTAPLTVTFSATATDDGSVTEYAWDFDGDGTFDATGASQTHTYDQPGMYHPVLRVRDNDGLYGYDASLSVSVAPFAITAEATPTTGNAPLPVDFNGSIVSLAPGRRIVRWQWDFDGDGRIDYASNTSPKIKQTLTPSGTYHALLTAVDDQNNRAHAVVTVTVANSPPTVNNSSSPTSGPAPLPVNLRGSASDADGTITLYQWDYNGDGLPDWASPSRLDTWFTFPAAGTYDTILTVTDDQGTSASASQTITVTSSQTPPVVSLESDRLIGNAPLTVTLTAPATDPDGTIASWSWDFDGDGATDTDAASPVTHTYSQSGTYPVTVTVTDNDGLTATASLLITVQAAGAPNARLQAAPTSGVLPLEVVFDGSNSSDADGSIVSYQWTFGEDTLWIASVGNDRIYRYRNAARLSEHTGMYNPHRLAVDDDGTVWVTDGNHGQVVRLSADNSTELLRLDGFDNPQGIAIDPRDHTIWVADYNHDQIVHLSNDGQELGRFDGFNNPLDIVVNPVDGSVWVTDLYNHQVVHLAADGSELARVSGFYNPQRLAVNPSDRSVWISDRDNQRLVRLTADTPNGYHVQKVHRVTTDGITGRDYPLFNEADATTGKLNGGLTLDGSGDYLLIPAAPALNVQSFTIEAWIKPASIYGEPAIFMRGNASGGNEIFFGLSSSSRFSILVDDQKSYFDGSANLQDGNWHHVALVFDQAAGQLTCYVDGAAYGTPQTLTATLDFGGSHALVGADFDSFNGSLGNYFKGDIDEVRLWSTARSAADIAAAMNTELTGTEDGLVGYWPCNTVSPTSYHRLIEGLQHPGALALDDRHQRLWVCDDYLDAVIGYDIATGREIVRIAEIKYPTAVAVDEHNGSVWVTDYDTDTARHFTIDGRAAGIIADLGDPTDIAIIPAATVSTPAATPTLRHTYPAAGTYLATLTVTDDTGLTATDTVRIEAGLGPEALPIAYPSIGPAPLDVRFVTNGRGPDGTIETFHWDFDGNGTFDWWSYIPEITFHTYERPGIYQAALRVTDNQGRTDQRTVTITVTAPEGDLYAEILATPAAGPAPLDVSLTAVARSTNAFVTAYQWDFDNDGTFDATGATVSHTFTTTGLHTVRLRVTDSGGHTTEATSRITVRAVGAPTATASGSPTEGPASLEVTFSGSGTDADGSITDYAWDFDGDGTFDHHATTPGDVTHTYETPGIYNAVFQITDDSGKTDTVVVPITVTAGLTATLDRDQFDPSAGETITINSALTGTATVTIRITDRSGHLLRTLLQDEVRTPGFYQDTWDGKDANGKTVGTGVYLYIIDYTVDGITYHYDLTNSLDTNVDKITPEYPSVFNPFSADTNFFRYTLSTKSEVTIYMSPFVGGAQTRAKTLQLRSPRRAGSYVQTWDGTDDLGNLVKPMDYVIAVFAWKLPPNAIIVENRPVIGDLHVTPSSLNPAAAPYDDLTSVSIVFSLSKDATVTARILDEDNYRVKTITANGTAGAGNSIVWDGTNEAGDLVAPGIYRIQLTAEDDLGHRSEEANTVLIIFY